MMRSTDCSGMGTRTAFACCLKNIAPPLQANFGHDRLAPCFACAGKFVIESVKGVEQRALVRRREEASEVSVRIEAANRRLALGERFDRMHCADPPLQKPSRGGSCNRSASKMHFSDHAEQHRDGEQGIHT